MAKYDARFSLRPLFSPCSEEVLQKTSRGLARPLPFPEEYLDFLRQWNGIRVDAANRVLIRHKDARNSDGNSEIMMLYGLAGEADPKKLAAVGDLSSAGKGYAFEQRVPSHLLAIGQDELWNRMCMSLGDDTFGKVYVWRPGEPWEPDGRDDVRTEEWLHPLANSFREFWDSLQTEDEYWKNNDDSDVEWEWDPFKSDK